MKNQEPIEIFISYSHKDEKYLLELDKHLASLKREGLIKPWHDRKITPGNEWASEIDSHIYEAKIILLLISVDFMASDYCYDSEMNQAIDRHNKGEAYVIPIILRPVDWHKTPFAKLQALPKDAKPVTNWTRQDDAYLDIVNGIRRTIQGLQSAATSSPIVESVDEANSRNSPKHSMKTKKVITPSNETQYNAAKANELFSEAIRRNLYGDAERALQLFREVKEIDKYYPNIDMEIRRLEQEINSGYTDRDGHIKERKIIPRSTGVVAALIGLIVTIALAIAAYAAATKPSISLISGRPIDELTYCSQDILNPAGARVIARWPTQHQRGLYIAVQKSTGIVRFRISGWDYLPSTQTNTFLSESNSGVCGYEAQWLTWTDSKSTDPSPGSIITIEFLNANEDIIVTLTLSVNPDGLGLTHISLEQ